MPYTSEHWINRISGFSHRDPLIDKKHGSEQVDWKSRKEVQFEEDFA